MRLPEVLKISLEKGALNAIICATEDDIQKQIPQIIDLLALSKEEIGVCRSQRALFEDMTVLENVFIHRNPALPISRRRQLKQYKQLQQRIKFSVDPFEKVKDLTGEEKYIVELMRLLIQEPRVVVINYILSFLSYHEYTIFCNVISLFRERQTSILILTSRWEDMTTICSDLILFNKSSGEYTLRNVSQLQENPQRMILELIGYENVGPSEDFLKTANAVYSMLSLFDMGKDLSHELVNLGNMAKEETHSLSCIFYLQSNGLKVTPYYDNNGHDEQYLIRSEIILQLIGDSADVRFFSKGKYQLNDMFKRPLEGVEMLVSAPIIVSPNSIGVMIMAFETHFVCTEEQIMTMRMICHSAADLIRASRLFNSMALIQESNHRIKNNLQIILSLIYMQKQALRKKGTNVFSREDLEDILEELVGRIRIIANVHDMMTRKVGDGGISLRELIEKVSKSYASGSCCLETDVENVLISNENAAWLAMIVNELICNSRKHAFWGTKRPERNRIIITARRNNGKLFLCIRDNGCGLPKGFDFEKAQSTGMRLIRTICRQLNAKITFETNRGTKVSLCIPEILS